MQENFLLKTKRAIKKVAAIGMGSAMLGLTAGGALAQASTLDLATYPSPFIIDGKYDSSNAFVVGANAEASDTLGAIDIAANLQFEAKECEPASDGTVSVTGGESEDVPIGSNIAATNQLDNELDDGDLDGLVDTTVNFKSGDYDVSDAIYFSRTNNVSVASSLTASDDDYESNVVLEVERDGLKYYYRFDETINLNGTSTTDPLEIKFLGKTIKITKTDSGTKFTAQVGTEYFLDIDDIVTVSGKKITLENVGSGGAVVIDVDGVQETLSSGTTRTINGIEITNDEAFYTDTRAERSATLIIGEDATQSYTDSDEYIGEDEDNPSWVWDIGNLTAATTTTTAIGVDGSIMVGGITLGVENDWRWVDGADADALLAGECLDLPNNYASVCFDSTTVADDNYLDLDISLEKRIDFTDSVTLSSADAIRIKSSVKESLKLKNNVLGVDNLTKDVKTDEVWIVHAVATAGFGNYSIFYKDVETNKKFFAGNTSAPLANNFMEIDFKDTKDTNIAFDLGLNGAAGAANVTNLTLDIRGDTASDLATVEDADEITIFFGNSTSAFSSLGATASSEEAGELTWNGSTVAANLGTKDEDHRTKYGVIIKDPKSNGASDEVKLSIPGDQVQANIVVRGPSTVAGARAGEVCTVADINPRTLLDTEVTNVESYNVIVVGGPAINSVAETLIGTADEFRATYSPGEAIIRLVENGNKVAMVVAGYNALDTRRAAKVVANYGDYGLTGTEALVKGTTLTDITVE